MCVFFEHFLQFFIDLLFGCLHKQSISIENVLSSRVVTFHSVVGNRENREIEKKIIQT